MRRFIFFSISLLLFSCHYNQKNPINAEEEQCYFSQPDESLVALRNNIKAKEEYLKDYFTSLNRSGVFNGNILVAENGRILYSGSFGFANKQKRTELNLNSRFQLASVTKIFTAVAILQLIEQSKLQLDDEVKTIIPEFPYDGITIRQLLCHRSGLPR